MKSSFIENHVSINGVIWFKLFGNEMIELDLVRESNKHFVVLVDIKSMRDGL